MTEEYFIMIDDVEQSFKTFECAVKAAIEFGKKCVYFRKEGVVHSIDVDDSMLSDEAQTSIDNTDSSEEAVEDSTEPLSTDSIKTNKELGFIQQQTTVDNTKEVIQQTSVPINIEVFNVSITAKHLNIRESASKDSKILGILNQFDIVRVGIIEGDFYHLVDRPGYIMRDFARVI